MEKKRKVQIEIPEKACINLAETRERVAPDVFQRLLIKAYFEWLCNLVGVTQEGRNYWCLFGKLYAKEFYGTVPNDDNRGVEGKQLRTLFLSEYMPFADDGSVSIDGPCRVLEMLIALAIRCEVHIMMDPEKGDRTKKWFWDMVYNLGFGDYTDAEFSYQVQSDIDDVLDIWLERRY